MTTPTTEHSAAQFAQDHLALVQAAYDEPSAMLYAGAMAAGVRNWVAERYGTRAAYDLLQGLADDILSNETV